MIKTTKLCEIFFCHIEFYLLSWYNIIFCLTPVICYNILLYSLMVFFAAIIESSVRDKIEDCYE